MTRGKYLVVPDVTSLTERESTAFSFFPFFFLLFFVFVNCSKKNHFDCSFCSLFHSFRLFFLGKNINLVNAKLVNTVLNLCTLKCVLCLYSCKYSEKYKRYLKMIIKIYWSCSTINVAIELDVGYKNKINVVLFWKYFSLTFFIFSLGVRSLNSARLCRVGRLCDCKFIFFVCRLSFHFSYLCGRFPPPPSLH